MWIFFYIYFILFIDCYPTELVGYVTKAGKLTNGAKEPFDRSSYRFPFVLQDKDLYLFITLNFLFIKLTK